MSLFFLVLMTCLQCLGMGENTAHLFEAVGKKKKVVALQNILLIILEVFP